MSKGPGHVQRTVLMALSHRPGQWRSLTSLVMEAFPGEEYEPKRRSSVLRACRKLAPHVAARTDHHGQGKGRETFFKYVPPA